LYFCVLGVLFVGCFFAMSKGVRFIEHFAVPVGILAGAAAGWFASNIGRQQWGSACIAPIFIAVLCAAAVAPSVVGSAQISAAMRPSATDASAQGMAWIRDNAKDPQAVIFSWWDNGYFYEAVSGHPCLWDGGIASSPVRAILVSKALTAHDPELSRRILLMLSGSGNAGAEYLLERTDAETAFDTVWDALLLDRPEAEELIAARCGMDRAEAAAADTSNATFSFTENSKYIPAWSEIFSSMFPISEDGVPG
jgi:asparagine N-glycosylation enzyme membrane subunit Stt3